MSKKDNRSPEEREAAMMKEHIEYADARLNEVISRREILEAIEGVRLQYGANGTHESTLISEAFEHFADLLK